MMLLMFLVLIHSLSADQVLETEAEKAAKAKKALDYVERVRTSACTGGTEEVLPVQFDHQMWSHYADVAVRMSNLLTKLILQGNNTLGNVDDAFLFNLVRNNVDSKSLIFGSAIAVEEYVYPKYRAFCPYAYKKGAVYSHDISLNYDYLDPNTEWYHVLRVKDWRQGHMSTNWVTYSNVDSKSLIFGSAIAVEEYVYPKYRAFCPYAYKKGAVYSHDISLNYDYLDPNTEWYHVLRVKDWRQGHMSTNWVTYRYNQTSHDYQQAILQPMAQLEDGHWTYPYYDCGGGNIWMVTYSAPIFGMDSNVSYPVFKGIGTIDIELTNIDINQCDAMDSSELEQEDNEGSQESQSVDVFRGTHNCRPTTKCVPIQGLGFMRGAYMCVCRDGFYFPQVDLPERLKAFNGSELEEIFSQSNASFHQDELYKYDCLHCAEGCDTCVDDSPCLYSYQLAVRIPLLALTLILIGFILIISVLVGLFKDKRAIKSSSPMFLHVMTCGSGLMCVPMIIGFIEPTELTCALKIWPRHIGFSLAYGALLLKTWRISAIFKVKSARRMNLSDKVLAQRFIPILGVVCAYLIAWMAIGRPTPTWRRTTSDLKFVDCTSDYWEMGILIGEACFLLWGAYLCYVVRKAPSHFNESKYITWSIYNNIILGTFIIVIKQFIAMGQGPDVIYMVDYMHLQVTVSITICLIFIPKIYVLNRVSDTNSEDNQTVTGRTKAKTMMTSAEDRPTTEDVETQTNLSAGDMELLLAEQPGEQPTSANGITDMAGQRSTLVSPISQT